MQIYFHGHQSFEEAAESLLSIIKLFKERYAITNYRDIHLNITLVDEQGEDLELVDATTSEVLGVFEVHKNEEFEAKPAPEKSPVRLVVDNTKQVISEK